MSNLLVKGCFSTLSFLCIILFSGSVHNYKNLFYQKKKLQKFVYSSVEIENSNSKPLPRDYLHGYIIDNTPKGQEEKKIMKRKYGIIFPPLKMSSFKHK